MTPVGKVHRMKQPLSKMADLVTAYLVVEIAICFANTCWLSIVDRVPLRHTNKRNMFIYRSEKRWKTENSGQKKNKKKKAVRSIGTDFQLVRRLI